MKYWIYFLIGLAELVLHVPSQKPQSKHDSAQPNHQFGFDRRFKEEIHISHHLERNSSFRESMSWTDEVVYGWITRKSFILENVLRFALKNDSTLVEYLLGPVSSDLLSAKSSQSANTFDLSEARVKWTLGQKYLKACSGHAIRNRIGERIDYNDPEDESGGWSSSACRFRREGRPYFICDSNRITTMPPIPLNLDLFELNSTRVKKINRGAFRGSRVRVIRLYGNDIETVAPYAFDGIQSTTVAQLIQNDLSWIWFEDSFFGLEDLISLQLEYNRISFRGFNEICIEKPNVSDIETVLPNLLHLSLRSNPLQLIPRTLFAPLRQSKVKNLILTNCELTSIHPEALSFFPHLEMLDLSENPKLMEKLFESLKSLKISNNTTLKRLFLAKNGLQKPPLSVLRLFEESLVTLDLSGNIFSSLNSDSFPKRMEKLRNLHLGSCNLKSVALGTFDGMLNLEVLMLSQNQLRQVPPPIPSLLKLASLDLSGNEVGTGLGAVPFQVLPNRFRNLEHLKALLLTNTWIPTLKVGDLKGLRSLSLLFLNGCRLGQIQPLALSELTNLEVLNLNGNFDLAPIHAKSFYGLESLHTLYLNSTRLELPLADEEDGERNNPFQYLRSLRRLYLHNNKIRNLKPALFSGLFSLETLDLSDNSVETWRKSIFGNRTSVKELYLNDNQIYTITNAMLDDFIEGQNPKVIDLRSNQLQCDSGTCSLKKFVEKKSFQLVNWDQPQNYECRNPGDFKKIRIQNLTDEFCRKLQPLITLPQNETETIQPSFEENEDTSGSNKSQTKGILFVLLGFIIGGGALGSFVYFKRSYFRYLWFGLKLKVIKDTGPAKAQECSHQKYEYDAFVSYSQPDSDYVQQLVSELEGNMEHGQEGPQDASHGTSSHFPPEIVLGCGDANKKQSTSSSIKAKLRNWTSNQDERVFKLCLHVRDFQAGAPIIENIIECVDRSRKILIVISKNYLESQWCIFEMNLAHHRLVEERRSSLVLILLEPIPEKSRTKTLDHLMKSMTYLEWPQQITPGSETELGIFWDRLRSALSSSEKK